jgi:hypothetical protein
MAPVNRISDKFGDPPEPDPPRNPPRNPPRKTVVIRSISDLKALRETLQRSERMGLADRLGLLFIGLFLLALLAAGVELLYLGYLLLVGLKNWLGI